MKIALKWTLCLVLSVIGLTTFTSCDDDENVPEAPKVTDVYGEYTGKMEYVLLTQEGKATATIPSVDVNATINNDTITFAKFPVEALVKAIITDENTANGIIEGLGDINYEIGYKASLNAANDTVAMKLDPKPLAIKGLPVSVNIAVAKEGVYSVEKKNATFELKATVTGLFEDGISLKFNLNKK